MELRRCQFSQNLGHQFAKEVRRFHEPERHSQGNVSTKTGNKSRVFSCSLAQRNLPVPLSRINHGDVLRGGHPFYAFFYVRQRKKLRAYVRI
ncbi:hypothetical protein AVEN_89103-1 [Araneus ventricosus]|uniref:Uncharacterized protein n=1 Tax=Araneus ventricosus TaxID=182803 RepID=A0A4Y2B124_ARAVE|nr:hypothetical protein AVEN_89103-1 [Araneus ventricosus]